MVLNKPFGWVWLYSDDPQNLLRVGTIEIYPLYWLLAYFIAEWRRMHKANSICMVDNLPKCFDAKEYEDTMNFDGDQQMKSFLVYKLFDHFTLPWSSVWIFYLSLAWKMSVAFSRMMNTISVLGFWSNTKQASQGPRCWGGTILFFLLCLFLSQIQMQACTMERYWAQKYTQDLIQRLCDNVETFVRIFKVFQFYPFIQCLINLFWLE